MSEASLARAIGDKLEGAGFVRKPGTNEFTAPAGFGGAVEATMTVDTDPTSQSKEEEKPMPEGAVAADELRLLVERAERVAEEIKASQDDLKDVFAEARVRGYDVKTIKAIIRLRKMETHHRQEAAALLETYASALGLQGVLL